MKQFENAIVDYDISLKIKPSHKAFANRALAYSELGMHLKAIQDYTSAINIFPQDKELYYRRGISYLALGKNDLACSDFKNSAKLGYLPAKAELNKNCPN